MSDSSLNAIGSVDAEAHRERLLAALATGGEAAVVAWSESMGDPDWRVRKEAVLHVGALPVSDVVAFTVQAIVQAENVGLRNSAIEVAGVLGDALVPALADAFSRERGASRRFLASGLGMTGSLAAAETLARACDDPDDNLVAAAIDGLARIGGPVAERAVRGQLARLDAYQRMTALDALDRMRANVSFEELETSLSDPMVRRAALALLGRTRSERALPILVPALSDRSLAVTAAAAVALETLSEASDELAEAVADASRKLDSVALSALRRVVDSGEPNARRAAAVLLLHARSNESLPAVLALAVESSLGSSSLAAISAWGDAAIAPLLALVPSSRGAVAALALELAADLGAASADDDVRTSVRAAIREALAAPADDLVHEAAVRSLAAYATLDDLDTLVALAISPRAEDAIRAAGVLESFVARDAGRIEAALSGIDAASGGGALCAVLAALGTDAAIDRIVACLSAPDPRCRRSAVLALSGVRGVRALETLAFALADEDLDVRATAAMVLGRMRDADGRAVGAERLLHALEHESPMVQVAAIEALVGLGDPRAREPVARLAASPDAVVAATAIRALRALGAERASEIAVMAAASGQVEVVVAALSVLGDRAVPASAAPFVVESLEHPAWEARLAAVRVAATLPDGVELLSLRARTEPEDIVQRAIADALDGGLR